MLSNYSLRCLQFHSYVRIKFHKSVTFKNISQKPGSENSLPILAKCQNNNPKWRRTGVAKQIKSSKKPTPYLALTARYRLQKQSINSQSSKNKQEPVRILLQTQKCCLKLSSFAIKPRTTSF